MSDKPTTPMTGKDVQRAIDEEGHDWSAHDVPAEEWGSGLKVAKADREKLGAAIATANAVDEMATTFGAPHAVDWRNNGGNWLTSIKNQQSCGSCISFATCATIESRLKIVNRNPNLEVDLSESHLFFCGCGNCCPRGWMFTPALNFARSTGIGLESNFPYRPMDQQCRHISPYAKVKSWRRLLGMADRKNRLASRGPMLGGIQIFSDFYNYRGGVYRKTANASLQGNHAICIVGYDDSQQCWIIKNSWGTAWGEGGYGRIAYGQGEIDSHFAFYDVDVELVRQPRPSPRPSPQPSPRPSPRPSPQPYNRCAQYTSYLNQVVSVARRENSMRFSLLYYICGQRWGAWRPAYRQREWQVAQHVNQILTACPQYREQLCRALRS